jgi:3,4-dihydroxy-2-butanone 4-phosphate synthase
MASELLDRSAVMAGDACAAAGSALARAGKVLLRDGEGGAERGYVLILAEFADAEAINFMATEARGLVCLALGAVRCEELELEQILPRGRRASHGDSSMVSIEAREGVTTGISAADRARTVAVAIDPTAAPDDLVQPGHVFPVRARPGGILERAAGVEAAVDLAGEVGAFGAGVFCQVMRDDGGVASQADLDAFASRHGLPQVTVAEVAAHRRAVAPPPPVPDTRRLMRDVMGHFATGVSVITARGPEGGPVGTTANAITSVSLDPPLLLACLAHGSETLSAIRATGCFGVNILADGQRHHSDRFAVKGSAAATHEVDFLAHESGVPLLPEALATIACEVEAIHPAGDHAIVVGDVRHLDHREPGVPPLLFFRGAYSRLESAS